MPACLGGPSCCWVSLSVRPAAGQLTQDTSWPVTPSHSPATALKMNMNLRELYLADNKLNGLQDSAQLGNLLKFNCSLQILDLRNNHVLDSGALPPTLPTLLPNTFCAQPGAKVGDAEYKRQLSQYCPPGFTDDRDVLAVTALIGAHTGESAKGWSQKSGPSL